MRNGCNDEKALYQAPAVWNGLTCSMEVGTLLHDCVLLLVFRDENSRNKQNSTTIGVHIMAVRRELFDKSVNQILKIETDLDQVEHPV